MKVTYVSCDATKLPFKSNQIDCINSYFGVSNMDGLISDALNEIKRVLHPEAYFFNCGMLVERDSPSYNTIQSFYQNRNENYPLNFLDKESFVQYHLDHGYIGEYLSAGSSIGEKNELDLIPVEGDWFEVGIFKGKKSRKS